MQHTSIRLYRMICSIFMARSLSDLRLIYCANGTSGSYYPDFSLHRMTMRLKIRPICPRFPTLLA
ncbi:MAG: hypothetical protein Q8K59_04960, partial [Nitrosomonas sp.]|nr:hypothetical protein [Nitrosomonas sp.]